MARRCPDFAPLNADAPNPGSWSACDVSVRLLNDRDRLPSVARDIAELQKSGAFKGFDSGWRGNNDSAELLAMIRSMMQRQVAPQSDQEVDNEEEDDEDDEDDDDEDEDEDDDEDEDEDDEDD